MKKLLFIVLSFLTFFAVAGDVKIVNVPGDMTVEKDGFKEISIRNLADAEIYKVFGITLLDDHIYVLNHKPIGLYKLDLQGKVIGKTGGKGEGPGEFRSPWSLNKFRGKLLCSDFFVKIMLYDRDLKLVEEIKFPSAVFIDLVENKEGNIIIPLRQISKSDKYFSLYSGDWKLSGYFGERPVRKDQKKSNQDFVFYLDYDREKDGIWAAFGDRYDLSYYEKEKLKTEIKEKNGHYKVTKLKDEKTGIVETEILGRPVKLKIIKEKVYYFYGKEKDFYCDIFNKNSFKLLRRIRLERYYRRIAHYKDGIFYGLYYGLKGDDDYRLYRLELK